MDLFDLVAKITLDSSEYEKGLDNSSEKAKGFGDKLKTAMKVGGTAITAVTTATSAMTGALVKGASDVASYGDNIDKMSQKMGMSAQAYQEWDAILQHSGSSIDAMSKGMITLQKKATDSADAFSALGISQEEVANMSTEELFAATIAGLQNMGEGAERTALASDLLGGAVKELGPLLNTSAEDTEAMRKRVHELGGVMSDEAVKSAAAYQDSLQDMQTAFSGLSRNMLSKFMPSITSVMDGLTEVFSGNTDGGIEMISNGISEVAAKISEEMPKILEVGSGIILALSQAITDNLPTLLEAGTNAIITISTGLIKQLPDIIAAGMTVIITLANGIAESLPELIPTIVDVIMQIVDTLTDPNNLGALVDADIAIMMALADGLIEALPILLEKAPEIVANLVDTVVQNAPKLLKAAFTMIQKLTEGLIENFPLILEAGANIIVKVIEGIGATISGLFEAGKEIVTSIQEGFDEKVQAAKDWGKDLIQNFIDGITAKWNALKQKITDIANTVKDFLGFSEPKKGPLSNFHTFAPDMIDLWNKTLKQNDYKLQAQFEESFDFEPKKIGFDSSRLGLSSAAIVNEISSLKNGNNRGGETTINLMLPDRTVIARYLINDLIDVSKSNGTPIASGVSRGIAIPI